MQKRVMILVQGYKEQTGQHDKDKHETQTTKMIHTISTALKRSVRNLLV